MKIYRPTHARLAALGRYVPTRTITNAELAKNGAMTEAEMQQLSGILERHWADPSDATSDLAARACREALQRANRTTVDRLVLATVSPDHVSPSTACAVQKLLELPPVPSFDVVAACSGFLFALDVAARAVDTGDEAVLACAAEIRSRFLDPSDRSTAALFGDGAAAAVITRSEKPNVLGIGLLSEGSGLKSVYVPAGGTREPASAETVANRRHYIRMADGPAVYFQAVEGMRSVAEELLTAFGMKFEDVDMVVPHQANRRLVDRLGRLCGIPQEKVMSNIERLGNTAGASVALALEEALRTNRVKPGGRVLLVTAGAGYTAGAALITVDEALVGTGSISRPPQPA